MDFILGFAIGGAVCAIIAWVFLPEPAFIRKFFVKIGWAKPVPPPAPSVPPPTP